MLLTVSKCLEFSASRRLRVAQWSDAENLSAFGPETNACYGSGRNYVAYFVFTGPVDPATGMLINISEIKGRAGKIVRARFDHKFLNEDNSSFRDVAPTAENIARQLYVDVAPLFSDVEAKLCACHLSESPERSATYYFSGACEANYWFEFSAARNTMSPRLSADENARLFGSATSTHGHNYRARLTFRSERFDGKDPFVCTSVTIFSLKLWGTKRFFSDCRRRSMRRIDCMQPRFPIPRTQNFMANATIQRVTVTDI